MKAGNSVESISEFEAEMKVLKSLAAGSLFGLEVAPDENRRPGEPAPVSDALGRCLTWGWVRTAAASSPDWRMHLTAAGDTELARREEYVQRAVGALA